ncbi:HAD-IIB family hydrolase [Enterococcus sp. HY326]|uniref:HAD-IIB family hydrolase n=1 Tax=Enterococcus sp. HY326 TaxID=2971265 RepID=UPI00223F1897|nr:HAD-IIB family hydrolase [Enterococcus sp. HY326]
MIKLVISDLDGTFLNSQSLFDKDYFRRVNNMMKEQGIAFSACTGKQCERVEKLFGEEFANDLWILGDSATRIKHQGEYVFESLLPNKIGMALIKKLMEIHNDYVIIACTPTAAFVLDTLPVNDVRMVRGSYEVVEVVPSFDNLTEDFVKITVYDNQLRCFETVKELTDFEDQAYIVASEAAWIDISNHGVHKGTTVAELQKILNVTPAETMVFGDGLNDIELMARGEYSFAMSNGFDQTKEAAAFITKSNDENGVLTTIEKILSLQK